MVRAFRREGEQRAIIAIQLVRITEPGRAQPCSPFLNQTADPTLVSVLTQRLPKRNETVLDMSIFLI